VTELELRQLYEREAFDLYGIVSKPSDLRRILTDYGFIAIRSARISRSPARRDALRPGAEAVYLSAVFDRARKCAG